MGALSFLDHPIVYLFLIIIGIWNVVYPSGDWQFYMGILAPADVPSGPFRGILTERIKQVVTPALNRGSIDGLARLS